jgi:hypothetical protein
MYAMTAISDIQLSEDENSIADNATATAVHLLQKTRPDDADCLALIINDHEGAENYSVELWLNQRSVVEQKIEEGMPREKVRWLYEHWSPDAVLGEVIGESCASPSLTHWKIAANRVRLYGIAVAVANRIRQQIPGLGRTPILVDNNHEYDELVFEAVEKANPDGQAEDWLAKPPPELG